MKYEFGFNLVVKWTRRTQPHCDKPNGILYAEKIIIGCYKNIAYDTKSHPLCFIHFDFETSFFFNKI